ncbi:ankyrin repeats (3 copies) domain-containing protein [Penicillium hispanicum]|uniref:ankyrin repeats (3 copies) domain-containing protein n=1 Tax=Penicillium hispanicum TaxID=1080232 RepID=UPI002541ABA7|nr:ankyrin repeats (3 copies) domain-containing protein [Penicillium hispanicum]KAJ5580030.1 ankyrin repeats (3 copies) domain-containing protein [Penicillium hispanicum]
MAPVPIDTTPKAFMELGLASLPFDIIFEIGGLIGSAKDLNSLAQVCRALYSQVNGLLYARDVRHRKAYSLSWGIIHGYFSTVQHCIDAGANLQTIRFAPYSESPLHRAVSMNDAPMVQFLIDNGAEVEGFDVIGNTTLHHAASNGNVDIARLLLHYGISPDVCSRNRTSPLYLQTPLHRAVKMGREGVVRVLCRSGADVNQRNKRGKTALHLALRAPELTRWSILQDLEDSDASSGTSARDSQQEESRKRQEIALFLIREGAHLDVKDKNSTTPVLLAARGGYLNVLNLLLRRGASPEPLKSAMRREGWDQLDHTLSILGTTPECECAEGSCDFCASAILNLQYVGEYGGW